MSHPLHQFTYCPKCGARTFVERNEKAKQCTTCGFVYYFNPSSAVACFIRNSKGELLLVRRAKEPAKGTLDLPGGFVDMFFECLTESFDGAKAEDDAAEIIILPANQLNPDDFGLQSIKKAVDRYIK